MDFSILLVAFGVVFTAEIIGDKSIYTISSLVTRFNTAAVFLGLSVAFCLKMLVAVLIGQVLSELPPPLLAAVSAFTFFATAFVLWFKKSDSNVPSHAATSFPKSTAISFASIFFIEWGDIGQITAAALTAQYKTPMTIWLGASLALIIKGLLAITLGLAIRKYFPKRLLFYTAIGLCLCLGMLSVCQMFIYP
jgi:putative Ca2+/H+ antiporter (TMEM165/GDT1 family)